jgi:hypothetical protein
MKRSIMILISTVVITLSLWGIRELFIQREHTLSLCEGSGWKIKEQRNLICFGTKKVYYSYFDFLKDRVSYQLHLGEYGR